MLQLILGCFDKFLPKGSVLTDPNLVSAELIYKFDVSGVKKQMEKFTK